MRSAPHGGAHDLSRLRLSGYTAFAMKATLAWSMTLGRLFFAPALIWLVLRDRTGWPIAALIAVEVILDIFDGIVARRFGVATSTLRRADSLVDTVFYLSVLFCAWTKHAAALRHQAPLLFTLLAFEAVRYAFDYWKFRREAAYHMWSSKAWGLVLGVAVIALLAYNQDGWLVSAALLFGILCDCEGLIISFLLSESVEDVPHVFRAIQLRRQQQASRLSIAAKA